MLHTVANKVNTSLLCVKSTRLWRVVSITPRPLYPLSFRYKTGCTQQSVCARQPIQNCRVTARTTTPSVKSAGRVLDTTLTELSHVLECRNKNRFPKSRSSPRSRQLLQQSLNCPRFTEPRLHYLVHRALFWAAWITFVRTYVHTYIPHFANCCCWPFNVMVLGSLYRPSNLRPMTASHPSTAELPFALSLTAVQRKTSINVHNRNKLNCKQFY